MAIPGGWGLRGGSWDTYHPSNEATPGFSPPASPGVSPPCPTLAGVSWAALDHGPALGLMQGTKPHSPSRRLAQVFSTSSRSQTLGFLERPPPPAWDAFPSYRLLAPGRWGTQACTALPRPRADELNTSPPHAPLGGLHPKPPLWSRIDFFARHVNCSL